MKVDLDHKDNVLTFHFTLEADDRPTVSDKVSMANTSCRVILPDDWTLEKVHPDVLALSVLLIVYPFTGPRLTLPVGISPEFAHLLRQKLYKTVQPVNPTLQPRKAPAGASPALAYSGGVDSTAALILMPRETKLFFLDRIFPEEGPKKSLYDPEAAHYACQFLKEEGRDLYMVQSDLEYVRQPVGFPVSEANAVPALLLSDYIGLDSIAFGTIMEAAYRVGHHRFEEYAQRSHHTVWGALFQAVDMPFNLVTAGISEVGTSRIVLHSPYRAIAQSCLRGKPGAPCLNCFKCLRKMMLDRILEGKELDDTFLAKLFKMRDAARYLTQSPIRHENVFAYITARYQGRFRLMKLLRKKCRGHRLDVSWMEKWYKPSAAFIHEKYRPYVTEEITRYLEVMSPKEEEAVRSWDVTGYQKTRRFARISARFEEALQRHAQGVDQPAARSSFFTKLFRKVW